MDKVMLIANPRAGSVSEPTKEVIVKALSADVKLEVWDTQAREHATELAEDAVDRDFDVVLAFGGDGTINEIAQPLVDTEVALGILPGGSTNVMARSLGIPTDPVEATAFIASRLVEGSRRRIGVGKVNNRFFLFSCGIGLDAEVVRRVEEHNSKTGKKTEWTFLNRALAAGSTEYRTSEPWLTIKVGDEEPIRGMMSIACNGWPFTYFKGWPVDACPQASLDDALDLLVLRKVRATTIPRIAWSVFRGGGHIRWRNSRYYHDVTDIAWEADVPKPLQVDGDFIGPHTSARLTHHPNALTLLI